MELPLSQKGDWFVCKMIEIIPFRQRKKREGEEKRKKKYSRGNVKIKP